VRDSSISGRQSLSKRTPSQHYYYSNQSHRPSLVRPSLSALSHEGEKEGERDENELDLTHSNLHLPETLVRLEEGMSSNTPLRIERGEKDREGGFSGSGKSSGSGYERDKEKEPFSHSHRSASRLVTLRGGSYLSTPPLLNIVVDLNTNEVIDMSDSSTPEKKESGDLNRGNGVVPKMIKSLKSAATVMQSGFMGFGFGLGVTEQPPALIRQESNESLRRSES
jgi:hypothetical protein